MEGGRDIDITVRADGIPRRGSEQGQTLHAESFYKQGHPVYWIVRALLLSTRINNAGAIWNCDRGFCHVS